MRVLSLFAGIGGFDLGFELAGFQTVAQVENDDYCSKILKHHFPHAKRYGDIREVTGEQITRDCGAIDIICGGFPCQDISSAGKGAGLEGERSGLWWEMHRLIGELRPTWVVIENVAALRARGLDRIVAALEEMGRQVWCLGIPASIVGAPHERKRITIVAYLPSKRRGSRRTKSKRQLGKTSAAGSSPSVADSDSNGIREQSWWSSGQGWEYSPFAFPARPGQRQYTFEAPRTIESYLGVTTNGIPRKLALRACGNAFVPAIPYVIARTIQRLDRALAQKSF